jgi:hypothetical protein
MAQTRKLYRSRTDRKLAGVRWTGSELQRRPNPDLGAVRGARPAWRPRPCHLSDAVDHRSRGAARHGLTGASAGPVWARAATTSAAPSASPPGSPPSQRRSGAGQPENGQASTRDEPVNLSDSRSETHQHCSPAGANCCQSLLLDPDATIGIDLHKRLFLLVTG